VISFRAAVGPSPGLGKGEPHSPKKFRETLKLQSAQCRCTGVEHLDSKALSKKSLMKKPAQVIIRKLTTIGLVFFAVSAINPAALARPKAAAIAFNHGDRDHHFDHGHRHFEFPYWWYADYGYGYDSPAAYDGRYWQDLAMKVQSELARLGYYYGQINGVIDSSSSQAIRAFQKARGLPVTGLIDPGVLRSLKLAE
jgi:hypothetical protein